MSPSDAHLGPLSTEPLRGSDPLASMGLPCCVAFFLYVPPPLPRRVTRRRDGCFPPSTAALPRVRVGSALATGLSGPAQGSLALRPADLLALLLRAFVRMTRRPRLPVSHPPVATRLNRPTASAGLSPARKASPFTARPNDRGFRGAERPRRNSASAQHLA